MPQLSPPPFLATPDSPSKDPIPSTSKISTTDAVVRPSSGSNSVEESQSPSGGGNETDDEREGSGSGVQTTSREDSDEQVPRQHHHEMYPFPSMAHHQFQRHSSAEVEASSAGSSSSAGSEFSEDEDEEDLKMNEVKRIEVPKRSLSEYRASLSRAGLAAPPRIRRIGALGISVHSDSDVENPQVSGLDTNDRIDPASGGDTSSGTRGTDLGVSMAALQAGNGSGSNSEGVNVSRKRKRGVADATFRGIVDELAVENRHLKDKLRRYEAHGVPLELKESRLFEIRFYDGLPIEKRTELEGFLTHYVRDFVEKGPSSSPPPPPKKAAVDFSTIRPPTPQTSAECVLPPASLPSPQESVRSERIENNEGRLLADSSNSGLEPFSLSGIGSGVYRPAGFFPSQPFQSLGNPARGPVPAIVTAQDRELAKSVISSLEQLFRHSLRQNKQEVPDETTKRSRSNETYMANFLSHDFLSDGWVYLNLASTMAELHHYSVTLNFVQQAVRDHSHNLEVSEDGKRIRWTGPSPTSSPPLSQAPSDDLDTSLDPSQPRPTKIASPAPTDSAASSGRTTVTQSSGNSSNPSSRDPDSNELLANSIAPTASTAPTSLAPSRSTNSKPVAEKSTRPQRPTAAVLQRMDRLSPPTASTQEDHAQGANSNSQVRHLAAKGDATKLDPSVPQPSISFIAHPDSAMRQPPSIFHRLLRNQAEEDLEFSKEDFIHPGRALPKGPGMLVYYANGHFCSDLTQDEPAEQVTETNRPFVLGALAASSPPNDLLSSSKATPIEFEYEDDAGVLNMDVGESSAEEEGTPSVDSHASSLRRLSASGMTNSTPADLFTILVKMNHPRKHDRKSSSDSLSNKRRRYSQAAPHILSSKAFHHRPLMTKRAAPVSFESTSSGDEPVVGRCHLTTSNLAKHTQPSLQQITPPLDDAPMRPLDSFDRTPSPPHDDYLLSLSAPLHAWAPREYNSITQRPLVPPRPITKSPIALQRRLANPYPARTFSDMSTTTGDERPISLDDPVTSGSRR